MNSQFWWYLARSSGIVAWALLTASMVWGLLFSTRLLKGHPTPRWLLDLHRHLGGLALSFTALHLVTLVADSYVEFGPADLLVPFVSNWRPLPVALGVVSFYLLVTVEVTSLAMKRLPRRIWLRIHFAGYLLFWLATVHGITAGTDATHPAYRAANTLAAAMVVFLTMYRLLAERTSRRRTHPRMAQPAGRSLQRVGRRRPEPRPAGAGRP